MPLIDSSLIDNFQIDAGNKGLRYASKKILEELGITPVTRYGEVSKTKPTIIISNHPGGLDTFSLFSSIDRDDLHFVALSKYYIFGKELSDKLLPIYRKKSLNHFLFEYPLNLVKGPEQSRPHNNEIKDKNKQSILMASQLINESNSLFVFPSGSVGKKNPTSKWKIGIAHLLKQIEHPEAEIVFAKIVGAGKTDIFRYMNPFLRNLFFKNKKRSVYLSKPLLLSNLIHSELSPTQILKNIETEYDKFFNTTSNSR